MPHSLIYFGSPTFSAQILSAVIRDLSPVVQVAGVVTQPDKIAGRNRALTASPVAKLATQHHLPIFKPTQLDDSNLSHLRLLKPDLFLTVSYGKIIPKNWLDLPTIAPLNLHFSLLPRYRGALCVSEAIKNGDQETGVTLMEMDQELDHGPLIAQINQPVSPDDNVATLTTKLTSKAITLLKTALPLYLTPPTGRLPVRRLQGVSLFLPPKPQNHTAATFTSPTSSRTRAAAHIPWKFIATAIKGQKLSSQDNKEFKRLFTINYSPLTMNALIRSFNPDPGAWTSAKSRSASGRKITFELKILKTTLSPKPYVLIPKLVQLPGRQPIPWRQFLAGHPLPL